MNNDKKSKNKRNIKTIIIDLLIAFVVASIIDTGNLVLDLILVVVVLTIIYLVLSLVRER